MTKSTMDLGSRSGIVSRTVPIDPEDEVFAGHYPGFPILPGLYLLEHVNDTVREATEVRWLRPESVDRIRFLSPVYPGDTVHIEANLTGHDDRLECRATVSTASGEAAEIRLSYPKISRGGNS